MVKNFRSTGSNSPGGCLNVSLQELKSKIRRLVFGVGLQRMFMKGRLFVLKVRFLPRIKGKGRFTNIGPVFAIFLGASSSVDTAAFWLRGIQGTEELRLGKLTEETPL